VAGADASDPARQVSGGGERSLTAADVARLVGGRIAADGDAAARVVRRVAPLDRAAADDVTFYSNARYARLFEETRAGVVLVSPALAEAAGAPGAVRVVVERPHEALLSVLPALYAPPPRRAGIHPTAVIGAGVRLGVGVAVGPHAVVDDGAALGDRVTVDAQCVVGAGVEIGDDTRLFPGVVLYPGTRLGRRVAVHAGARLGSDGFGYVYAEGAHRKIPHVGRCIVEDDVEIGANTTVDRGSIDDTVIGAGTKVDNLVHVGHNVRIGRLCLLMAQVGIAGSAAIEDGCILAGQAGVGGHVTVGARARVAGQAGVMGDVPAGATWGGYPARPHKESLRAHAAAFRLAGLVGRLERMLAWFEADRANAAAQGGR
jgi:UDP-3-O-[3-hydroxymyristoyl] glucosamine N-acyltransferase